MFECLNFLEKTQDSEIAGSNVAQHKAVYL
jgi:hypothetical protein